MQQQYKQQMRKTTTRIHFVTPIAENITCWKWL